jgi:glutamine---fructose-6-phosphate transaminase (isomerizing)
MAGERMDREMRQQPEILSRLLARRGEIIGSVRGVLPGDLAGVVLIARGSSDHAAILGRYLIEAVARRPVGLAAPSVLTLYGSEVDYRGYLVVAVSQSGRTPEIVDVLGRARARGARTVAITNEADSPLAEGADVTVHLDAGTEEAVPATKTFTAQVAAFALLAGAFGSVPWDEDAWERVPASVSSVLEDPEPAGLVAEALREAEGLIAVGRGYLFAIALEAALKLKEVTGILAEGYSAADLLHGPVAVVEQGFPVLTFVAPGPARASMEELRAVLDRRGARVFLVGEDPTADLPVPGGIPEPLATIPVAVRAQQLAYSLGLRKGLDPDVPEGLTKVTFTR